VSVWRQLTAVPLMRRFKALNAPTPVPKHGANGLLSLEASIRVVQVERLGHAVGGCAVQAHVVLDEPAQRPAQVDAGGVEGGELVARYVYGCWEMTTSRPKAARPVAAATATHSSFVGRRRNNG